MYGNKLNLGWPIANRGERKQFAKQMRKSPTPAERRFAQRLTEAGIPFKDQKPIGLYIVDFFVTDRMVIIEIDGGYHDVEEQKRKDEFKDEFFRRCGLPVFRVRNEEVETWPFDALYKYCVKSKRAYASIMGRVGRLKGLHVQERGFVVSGPMRRKIRAHFGLPPTADIPWNLVQRYQREVEAG